MRTCSCPQHLTISQLKSRYAKLNPAELKRRILGLQARLYEEVILKKGKSEFEEEQEAEDLEYIFQ